MSFALIPAAVVACLAAAVRSTWSPCGWSMLSTITPLSERGRGHRFAATATWFVCGAAIGGALLGALTAGLAAGVAAFHLGWSARLALGATATLVAAAWDAGLVSPALPHHRRQVNEAWLDEFRPWVYAAGFGLQIGFGLATYIMSAGVYLVIALGALSGQPLVAGAIAVGFGVTRGLAVLLGRNNTDPERLASFHLRFANLEQPARRAVVAVLVAVGAGLLAAAAGAPTWVSLVVPVAAAIGAAAIALVVVAAGAAQAGATVIPDNAPLSRPTSVDRRATEPTTA